MSLRRVLLNPGPVTTTDTVKQALLVPDTCPREREFKEVITRVTRRLVEVVGGGDEYMAVLFEGSGTAVLEACIASIVPPDRALLVVSNGGYGQRLLDIARVYQLDVVLYSIPWGAYPYVGAVERLLGAHQGRVSHLAVVHHETTTGMLNPVTEMAALAHHYGAETIVDAMSSYAGLPIDVKRSGIDYLVASSSKCVQAIPGLSFVICLRESLVRHTLAQPRSYYLDLHAQMAMLQSEGCMRFTAPVQILHALDQALREWFEETGEGRYRRYRENYRELVDGLGELGFRFLLPPEQRSQLVTTVIEPTHPAYSYDRLHDYLYERGFTIYPDKGSAEGTFRLASFGQIDRNDIRAFLKALECYITETGIAGRLYEGSERGRS